MGIDHKEIDNEAIPKIETSDPAIDLEKATIEDKLKSKVKTMQRRIDELREKVNYEGSFINAELSVIDTETTLETSFVNKGYCESNSDLQSVLGKITHSGSEKSLYYSASEYSLSSQCSTTAGSSCYNFSGFVGNFSTDQHEKERFSLLQLHSERQISSNVTRNLLEEIGLRCSEELKLVDVSLKKLHKLAVEFGVKIDQSPMEFEGKNST